jgi:hypothetical protein
MFKVNSSFVVPRLSSFIRGSRMINGTRIDLCSYHRGMTRKNKISDKRTSQWRFSVYE